MCERSIIDEVKHLEGMGMAALKKCDLKDRHLERIGPFVLHGWFFEK